MCQVPLSARHPNLPGPPPFQAHLPQFSNLLTTLLPFFCSQLLPKSRLVCTYFASKHTCHKAPPSPPPKPTAALPSWPLPTSTTGAVEQQKSHTTTHLLHAPEGVSAPCRCHPVPAPACVLTQLQCQQQYAQRGWCTCDKSHPVRGCETISRAAAAAGQQSSRSNSTSAAG